MEAGKGYLPQLLELARVPSPVPRALRPPPVGAHLHDHPSPALGAKAWRLQAELSRGRHVTARGCTGVDVELGGHRYSVALSALIGICRSSSRSRSASAGRPRVVR
jgi:hypothetical protein